MTTISNDYDTAVASWRSGLSNMECRDFYADWRKGDNDPATIDGAMEYMARRSGQRLKLSRKMPRQGGAA